jgi:hypothetical protein
MSANLGSGGGGQMVTDSLHDGTLVASLDRKVLTLRYVARGSVDVQIHGIGQDGVEVDMVTPIFNYDGVKTVTLDEAFNEGENVSVHYLTN